MNFKSKINEEVILLILRTLLKLVDTILSMNEERLKERNKSIEADETKTVADDADTKTPQP